MSEFGESDSSSVEDSSSDTSWKQSAVDTIVRQETEQGKTATIAFAGQTNDGTMIVLADVGKEGEEIDFEDYSEGKGSKVYIIKKSPTSKDFTIVPVTVIGVEFTYGATVYYDLKADDIDPNLPPGAKASFGTATSIPGDTGSHNIRNELRDAKESARAPNSNIEILGEELLERAHAYLSIHTPRQGSVQNNNTISPIVADLSVPQKFQAK